MKYFKNLTAIFYKKNSNSLSSMPNKCWVPYYKTNSAITKNEQEEKNTTDELDEREKYSVFRFPSNPELKNKLVQNIKRKNEEPTQNSLICARRFTDNCFHNYSPTDAKGGERFKFRLKKDAVPTIFPEYSSYYAIIRKPQEKTAVKTNATVLC